MLNLVNSERGLSTLPCGPLRQTCGRVPLFPELRPLMEDAYQLAEPGAEFVITRYRLPSCNLRTQLHRILARAGVTPWEKIFHNLRSSRQTELTQTRPTHVVCAWLGNSPTIAHNH